MNAIELNNLVFGYRAQQTIIDIKQWNVAKQQHSFVYGPSGTGKTTLLNLLGGVLTPQQGDIKLLGQAFSELSTRKKDAFRANHIGMVFQQFNLVPYLSVLQNIQLATQFASASDANWQQRTEQLFEQLKLDKSLFTQRADALSVGQQQRVAIVRALINKPQLIIADEPTSALDSDTRDSFMQLLLELVAQEQSTLIFVSHDHSLADYFTNQVALTNLNQSTGATA